MGAKPGPKPTVHIDWQAFDRRVEAGQTLSAIAKELKISRQSLYNRLQTRQKSVSMPVAIQDKEALDSFKEHRADILADKQREILSHVSKDKLEKASAYQLTGMASLCQQMERLERGQSTSNVSLFAHVLDRAEAELDSKDLG